MKVSFNTLGCKINQFYTNCLKQKYIEEGNDVVSLEETPNIAYINTCAVTARAGSESRKLYRKAKKNACEVLILGCQAKLFPYEFEEEYCIDEDHLVDKDYTPISGRARPYLPIQFGCNNFCAYCIVPYARGKSYSLPDTKIIENIKKLIDKGYKEVVLTGIHIGNYQYKKQSLKELLEKLLNFNINIRLTSITPNYFDMDFINLFKNKNLMPHIHLSQQSGSNKILKKMQRNYNREKTLWLAEKLRNIRRDIRLAGDFIVGFPGETEKDFADTANLIERAKFSHLHIFRYSERPYTLAGFYPDKVKDSTKKERARILKKLGELKRKEFVEKNIGEVYDVIIEGKSHLSKGLLTGITPNYIKIHFIANGKKTGIVSVEILKFENGLVYGKAKK